MRHAMVADIFMKLQYTTEHILVAKYPGTQTAITDAEMSFSWKKMDRALQWRHNWRDSVSNHQPHHCLLNRLFKAPIEENIKAPRHWPFCGEFAGHRWIPRTKGQ